MRPLHLQLQAFGPFSGSQALDFTELGDNPLFLISGSTGSGKTTILDAICFALYGDSSGETREPREMRSDHADPETLTEVIFGFTLGNRAYRVHRIPEQVRPKKTGEGFTTQKSDATLWERTDASEGEEGTVLASGWSKVTTAVEGLIRFSSQQFRQVIMLPQGKFRELLDSGSQQREAILEQLFPTELYGKIQDALADRARTLKGELKTLEERKASLLKYHELEDQEGLERRLEELTSEQAGLKARLATAEGERERAQDALTRGRTLEGHFRDLETAKNQMNALEARAPEIEEKKERVTQAEKARGLLDLFQQFEKAHRKVREAQEKTTDRDAALTRAQDAFREAGARLDTEEGRKEEREILTREIARLEGILEKVEPLAKARDEFNTCRAAVQKARQAESDAGEAVSRLEAEESGAREAMEKEKEAAGKLGELAGKLETRSRQLNDRRALAKAQEEHAAALTSMGNLETAKAAAAAALRSAAEREAAARSVWERGQAALLAGTLEPETPCPVCGSTHHPSPATSEEALPTEEEMERLKAAVEATRKEESRVDRELTGARKDAQALEQRMAELREQLGTEAELSAETLREKHDDLKALEAAARKAREALPELRSAHEKAQRALEEARTAQKNAEKARIAADGELRAAEARVREREAQVPEEYRTEDGVAGELKEKKNARDAAEKALEEAVKQEKAAGLVLRGAQESAKEARKALETAREEASADEAHWVERRSGAGFDSDPAYQEALLEPGQLEAMTEELREYAEERVRADRDRQKAQELTRNRIRPDIPALEEAEATAREVAEQVLKDLTNAGSELEKAQHLKNELEEIDAGIRKQDEEYGVIGHLSEVANGRSMTFQRFVLAVYLDYVLRAASERLNRMTSGRYRLVRRTVQADKRSHAGLDLDVEDSYTGKARPVSTLSGGESFLSALSLAMGLAEVVQQFSGGVRLDTIFVDEGFGSLDPGALDQAVNALMELQETGRAVGVISHVPELKERIDVRLDVHGSRTGSWAEFVVP